MMDVSVLIINYNSGKDICNCIDSLVAQTNDLNYEIIVVDNASTDLSVESIRKYRNIKLITNDKNIGFGAANNIGLKHSSGEYVFLLNPDTVLLNNAAKIFFDFMENDENKNVACCGGRLFDENMGPSISYGSFPKFKDIYRYIYRSEKLSDFANTLFNGNNTSSCTTGINTDPEIIRDVNYISGADLFLRKNVLEKVGVFDEAFFMYFEETELCYRLKKNNYQIKYVPEARIIHFCGTNKLKAAFNETTERYWKNSEFHFYEKCYGKSYRYAAVLIHIFICIRYIIQKRNTDWLTMLKIVLEEGLLFNKNNK
jgi:GT2 family glycosyltransferase